MLKLLNIILGLVDAFKQDLQRNMAKKIDIIVILISILIILIIISYNYNNNNILSKSIKGQICEIKVDVQQDDELNFFLKYHLNFNNLDIKQYYKETIISYLQSKSLKKDYFKTLDKNFLAGNYMFDKINYKYYSRVILNKKNSLKNFNLEIIKDDIEKNANAVAYLLYFDQINNFKLELKNLKKKNNFFLKSEEINFENKMLPIKKIFFVSDFKCKKNNTSKVNKIILINILFFFIIYFFLIRKII